MSILLLGLLVNYYISSFLNKKNLNYFKTQCFA
jgi:hypothetical protein